MHPKIKKFWEDTGYEVDTDVLVGPGSADSPWRLYWFLMKDEKQLRLIGMSDIQRGGKVRPPCTTYFINDREYTEEEALRIIKLKVFL